MSEAAIMKAQAEAKQHAAPEPAPANSTKVEAPPADGTNSTRVSMYKKKFSVEMKLQSAKK